ncbi:biosynthetic arginine decarboxylase [Pectobacterium quasiaquaticum]|uniref:Biosynthetic arginine decarboxylase n=1 Tax=Pectobacterium quasiaquaticum TaxID=2774015 RepID=A0A9Q2ELB2_9GAMM|nr:MULTISPECIES: biosynthetic arginine decarboxylase [Pectobacterium]MBE5204021.1 biosynthetic arginine decarboxylase [Pectobacterium quasiaquaticum]MBE5210522.1 biosynthetic arginine decarboxylase [Pectobacterium quasiaquaticum]MBE5214988.1 biosynthetic arginine decarboxylase [Pectobacterium quasiaquaticum]MBE5221769.1 biosynthetic arginine decarboxylase [Pectobacterium quasiaquaticum]MBE5224416.1 biosynthetic arginine decarboxylase [Pectobacterium quasiaquaticum]
MSDDMIHHGSSATGKHENLRSMQEVAMNDRNASEMLRTYNIAWWGNNYYDVNELGHISVCPDPDVPEARVDLARLVKDMQKESHQRLPALFCFPQILQHRLRSINAAFKQARESFGYEGGYFLVYPIKVNQHRRVIESLANSGEPLGLEAGSKAELMAVLGHAGMTRTVIVCNGYKDREYIRLALIGEKLGHKVYLVIEKMSEIRLVLEEAERLNVVPRLGVRARLASQGSGKWQSSGGEKSKFGLAAVQVLQLVEMLREAGRLDSLQLLHFHLGSQLANIRDIATGVRESARFYVELHKLGVNIQCFDVGGGLGVDYEGTRSQSDCSVNYGLNEYANNVIWGIGDACNEHGLPHPTVITESGRAVTAHHTVLVSNIIGVERNEFSDPTEPEEGAPRALESLWSTWKEIKQPGKRRSLREWLHDSQMDLHDVHTQYTHGMLDLTQRAKAEQLYLSICQMIQEQLDPSNRAHRPIIDELQERMADKLYVNFSLFQSMPDAWGIDQLFPVMPLEGLNKPPERRAVVLDITCDSDGTIDHYVDGDGIATTMPMPPYDPENPPLLGFFMVGAYQEILGNMHNLFGDTSTVDVFVFQDGTVEIEESDEGNTVADMLEYVQLDPKVLMTRFRDQVKETDLDTELQAQFLEEFETGLYGYTYLEDEE